MVLSTLLQNRVVLFPTSEPHGPLSIYLLQNLVGLLFPSEPHGLLLSPPKPCGPLHSPSEPRGPLSFPPNRMVLSLSLAATPRFKSQCLSSFAAPFPTPPTISYTCQHPIFFQLYWAVTVSPGRCGPMAKSQSSPSSPTGPVTRGSCFPVPPWVEVTPISLAQSRATAI